MEKKYQIFIIEEKYQFFVINRRENSLAVTGYWLTGVREQITFQLNLPKYFLKFMLTKLFLCSCQGFLYSMLFTLLNVLFFRNLPCWRLFFFWLLVFYFKKSNHVLYHAAENKCDSKQPSIAPLQVVIHFSFVAILLRIL